jgi:hypothetical protein
LGSTEAHIPRAAKDINTCLILARISSQTSIHILISQYQHPNIAKTLLLIFKMMPTSLILAVASACMAAAAAVPSPSFTYPQGVTVTEYPNGLPEELKPTENNSTELSLEKRASAGVYFCTDRNFAGFCAHIFAEEYTCGES